MYTKISLFLLRVSLGWMFLYAGWSHVADKSWTSKGYLMSAKVLPGFYHWLATPTMLPINNFVNEWALVILGVCLILGLGIRYVGVLSALLMLLYFLPLGILHPNAHSYIVDEHIIYIFAFLALSALHAGHIWGLDGKMKPVYPHVLPR